MIFVGCDHAGLDLKKAIFAWLQSRALDFEDAGCFSEDSCDYPDIARELALKVRASSEHLGILICGTGIGMSIAANKVPGIRAAHVSDVKSAQLAREHNHAQIVCVGSRILSEEEALNCVKTFLSAMPDQDSRHLRRVEKIRKMEPTEC
jgi:RpiB/LacA/LacB family sugar-phosphate isomerase